MLMCDCFIITASSGKVEVYALVLEAEHTCTQLIGVCNVPVSLTNAVLAFHDEESCDGDGGGSYWRLRLCITSAKDSECTSTTLKLSAIPGGHPTANPPLHR